MWYITLLDYVLGYVLVYAVGVFDNETHSFKVVPYAANKLIVELHACWF